MLHNDTILLKLQIFQKNQKTDFKKQDQALLIIKYIIIKNK